MKIVNPEAAKLLACPGCVRCGGETRLYGIEPHPTAAHTDLRTFVCKECDAVQTEVVALEQ
jgi:hypothetical protein